MRIAAALGVVAALAGTAAAAPWRLDTDVDGPLRLELDARGNLRIDKGTQTATVSIAHAVTRATLSAARVKNVPTIVADVDSGSEEEAVVLQPDGRTWKQVLRTQVGGVGADREHTIEVDATPIGIFRYQGRAGYRRCDGKPAYLLAEGYDGAKFRRLARIPTGVPDDAPVVTARPDGQPAATPVIYQARVASHQHGAGDDVGALAIPSELDDGKPTTFWSEDFAASGGEGQFFTFEARVGKASAAQLRVVPGNPTSARTLHAFNRPRRLGVVWATGAVHVDLPDAANDSLGTAYVADLPGPIGGCVTVVLESVYAGASNTTAIGELEVFAEGERAGGGDAMLATVIAVGGDGERAAAQELARHGAAGVAALDGELAKAPDDAARRRLVRALLAIKDATAGPVLARVVTQGGLHDRDLDDAIAALGELRQGPTLHDVATNESLPVSARVAAVQALAKIDPKLVVELAGGGTRVLRHAVIEALSLLPVATLVPA
ncbi:MAG: HEAT repeat domain-containing protein, partial [Acidobacteriota bacterium]